MPAVADDACTGVVDFGDKFLSVLGDKYLKCILFCGKDVNSEFASSHLFCVC